MADDAKTGCAILGGISFLLLLAIGAVALGMWGCPQYNVYREGLGGEAELKRAEQNRRIAIQEAEAKKESAKLLAQAEVERARGVAEANKIIGEGLKGHEEYLMYLWIMSLGDKDNHVIYVPTEANLPILEASRFQKPLKKAEEGK